MKKFKTLIFIFTLIFHCIENSDAQEMHFGFQENTQSSCLTEHEHQAIIQKLDHQKQQLIQQGILPEVSTTRSFPSFSWPIGVNPSFPQFQSCYSKGPYFDQNPNTESIQDYNCGGRTYDGHTGTDIGLWPFSWYQVEQNVAHIVAAAPGIIIGKDDGNYSYNCAWNSSTWNAVYIQHADGTVAWYGHMKAGTLTSKQVGDAVTVGEYLGVAGSSGISTGPHLHFEVLTVDNVSVDPFHANCNYTGTSSLWQNQKNYYEPTVNAVFTHGAPPIFMNCGDPDITNFKNTFTPGERVYAAMYLREIRDTDVMTFNILKPNGSIFFTTPVSVTSYFQNAYFYWYFDGNITDLGTWTVQAILNNGSPVSSTFTVTQNANPAISILGTSIPGVEWDNDYQLSTTDGINYYGYNIYMDQGECKFRQNRSWTTNWGQTQFPSGTGFNNGPNIPVNTFGFYNVEFNRLTGAYNFTSGTYERNISIVGTSLNGWDTDQNLTSSDGVNYIVSGLSFSNGEAKFRLNGNWLCNWGANAFPSGNGTNNGANIPVTAGIYDVTLNRYTGDYTFSPTVLTGIDLIKNTSPMVFPNPAVDKISVFWNTNEDVSIRIFDLQGKLLMQNRLMNASTIQAFSIETLPAGIYMIELQTTSQNATQRLVKF